jgi:putative polyketide hydroxylase
MSLFLSRHGIASLLVERHPDTSIHPRVAGLTARTMELYREIGIEAAIRQVEPPFSRDHVVPLVESLVGQEIDCLMEDMSAYFTEASPVRGSLIAQDVLEPVLRAHAEQAGGDLRYATELVAFEQDEEGITATIRERQGATSRRVRASFLVAADGSHSGIRQHLGVAQHGPGTISRMISMIFEAELLELFHTRQAIMCFINNETIPLGALVPYPGSAARPDLFRLDVPSDPAAETVAAYPEVRCLSLIRAAVGVPDLPVTLKAVLPYEMAARVADRFQQDRVFLVGDAARVQPPSGGLGGNTGIAEAHNLAWKLAAVLRGEAGPALLVTYDQERRPVADLTVEQVVLLSQERQSGSEAITVDTLSLSMGYRYPTGAIVPEQDGDLSLAQQPLQWRGQPGTRAPHLVLARDGQQISALDLFGREWVALIGAEGQAWKLAAQRAAERLHLPLRILMIDDELADVDDSFSSAYGLTGTGVTLVRPDGFIGWRSPIGEGEPERVLSQALSAMLAR